MVWAPPTIAEFKARWSPRFDAVADGPIQAALDEAALQVDETWVDEPNYRQGILLLAAHILTLDGYGTGAEAEAGAAGASGFKVMRSGQLTLERFTAADAGGGDEGVLATTSYGRRFLDLLKRNIPAVAIV